MKLDDDKEAVAILNNGLGSYGNRARAIYNKGYKAGFEDGKRDAIERLVDSLYADRKTKLVKYYDEDEKVWKIGEVIVDE